MSSHYSRAQNICNQEGKYQYPGIIWIAMLYLYLVADLMWLPRHLFGFSFQDSTHLSQTKLFTRFLFFVISFFALDGNVFMPKY